MTPRVSKYEYNFAGALVKETYPSGREVRNEFESDGDLSRIYGKVNQNATERTYANGFSYTPDGKIQRLKLGNNRWESAKFNERLQVTELALGTSDGDGSLWKLQYEYGELQSNGTVDTAKNTGNIAKQTVSFNGLTNPFVQTYKYDSLYRLTEAKEVAGTTQNWKESYGYDRYGNRLDYHKFVGTTELTLDNKAHPTIDSNTNRFTDTVTFNYDKNGNLIKDGESRNFVFNGENKQAEIKDSNGATIGQYFYDGEGKRVKKVTNTEITVFVYSAGKLVAEYSTATPPTNPTTKWTATDQLGSPRVITDSSGQVISRRDFMPFGEEVANSIGERQTTNLKYGTTDGIRQKFTGYQKDEETGLDFAQARMYENQHGRFTAVDPLLASGKSANPQTFNRFVYVMNNPLIFTDPTGLQAGCVLQEGNCQVNVSGNDSQQIVGTEWKNTTENFGRFGSVRSLQERPVFQTETCVPAYQCAGLRDPAKDAENAFAFYEGWIKGPIDGAANRIKSFFDVPNYEIFSESKLFGYTIIPRTTLSTLGWANPWFSYTAPQNSYQAVGQTAGGLGVDIGVGWATGRLLGAGGGTVTVYRAEMPINQMITIGKNGEVAVANNRMLFLSFGNLERTEYFAAKRIRQNQVGVEIKSFQVNRSYFEEIRNSAVPESMRKTFPNSPIIVDLPHPNQFGIPKCQIGNLCNNIIQGTGAGFPRN